MAGLLLASPHAPACICAVAPHFMLPPDNFALSLHVRVQETAAAAPTQVADTATLSIVLGITTRHVTRIVMNPEATLVRV